MQTKNLHDITPDDLALRLALIVQHHPELVMLIEAWPSLPDRIRKRTIDAIEPRKECDHAE